MNKQILIRKATKLFLLFALSLIPMSFFSCQGQSSNEIKTLQLDTIVDSIKISLYSIEGSKVDEYGVSQCEKYSSYQGGIDTKACAIYGMDLPKTFANLLMSSEKFVRNESSKLPKYFVSLQLDTNKDKLGDLMPVVDCISNHYGVQASLEQKDIDVYVLSLADSNLFVDKYSIDPSDDLPMTLKMYEKEIVFENYTLEAFANFLNKELTTSGVYLSDSVDDASANRRFTLSIPQETFNDIDKLMLFLNRELALKQELKVIAQDYLILRDQ